MKTSSIRITKIAIAFLAALLCWFYFTNLPWYPHVEIEFKDFIGRKINIQLEKSDHSVRNIVFIPSKNQTIFKSSATKVISIEQYDIATEVEYRLQYNSHKIWLNRGITYLPEPISQRNSDHVFEACLIVSVFIFLLIWVFLENARWSISQPKITLSLFALHASILGIIFWFSFPGFFGWDTFDNYLMAATYHSSTFVGDFYNSLITVGYQTLPQMWIAGGFIFLVILICLTLISNMARRLGTLKYYLIGLTIFFLYPGNIALTFFVVRDISCFWIMVTTLFLYYDSYLKQENDFGSFLLITFGTLLSCLMRQESIYILLPGLIVISYFQFKLFFKKSLVVLAVVFFASCLLSIINPPKISFYRYQATLLINPLSYILKAKYPQKLPDDVDAKLGKFFKNHNLIKYQQDHEIDPFHHGGLNLFATESDYEQFRSAALDIFLQNPGLFIKNRLIMMSYLTSINTKWKAIYSDEYYLNSTINRPEYFTEVMNRLVIEQENRTHFKYTIDQELLKLIYDSPRLFASYFIPFFLILGGLFIKPRSRLFTAFCVIILLRSLLICLIAPAGYFKYLYPLWIFAPFVFCLLLGERKLRLTKVQ